MQPATDPATSRSETGRSVSVWARDAFTLHPSFKGPKELYNTHLVPLSSLGPKSELHGGTWTLGGRFRVTGAKFVAGRRDQTNRTA